MSFCALGAYSQNRSAYFSDNYIYGFQLNPAFASETGFISMPGIGNLNIAVDGNVGINKFLFNTNGRTTTFMNPEISASEFLKGLKTNNRIGANGRIGILTVGFNAFGGFNTISLNTVFDVQARMPKSVFSFLKEGVQNRTYDISNLDAHADAYVELALNHSHKINDRLRVGAAVKLLVGGGNIDVNMNSAKLVLGENAWTAETDARVLANFKGLAYKTEINDRTGHEYISGVSLDGPKGIGGIGLAFDLGAVYKLNQDWTFSAAFTDIGFISWSNNMEASTNGVHTFNTDDYIFDPDDFGSTWDVMGDRLSALYELEDNGDTGRRNRALSATMNAGAEYVFPLYRPLSFGVLNTTRIAGRFSWTDFRLSATVKPVKCLSASVNYGIGTFGSSFGWVPNLSLTGFNLFIGMDHTVGKLARQGVPLNSNAQFSLGINFPFGK